MSRRKPRASLQFEIEANSSNAQAHPRLVTFTRTLGGMSSHHLSSSGRATFGGPPAHSHAASTREALQAYIGERSSPHSAPRAGH